jgi:4-diphosphocytidyl-2-C-methyl-D-erythritol kinase
MDRARASGRRADAMNCVIISTPAKINLTLEVTGRRADGYHDLASVFASVDLCDRVRIGTARSLDVRISPPLVDANGEDLASRAVRVLATATGREPAAYVRVRKRIPVAAGLGGGSSDAAAVLRGLVRVWRPTPLDLMTIGAAIGSDVPFFVRDVPFALVRGRGEVVDPLPSPAAPLWIVLVRIAARVSTKDVFAAHRAPPSDGSASRAVADAFRRGDVRAAALRAHLTNDLLAAAEGVAPQIADARRSARERGIDLVLSGSGPSLFTLADDRPHAIRLARTLRRAGLRARPHALGATS